ncbi:hypothetical protein M8J76_016361 [Diaphorina citri]|nr:hypothetical protein M8J76_016361 [Diaphorina citri]
MDLYIGSAIHWNTDTDAIEYLERCALAVEDGKITEFTADSSRVADLSADSRSHVLTSTQFLLPGFIDAHVHAPQYPNLGLGVDLPLLTWLRTYIFALERKFADLSYATTVYDKVVDRLIANGTTTASYFGTIHTDACLLLADTVHRKGQRGYVGKVNMTVNCESYYGETVQESLQETERFVEEMRKKNYSTVQPIITPRFAVTCDMPLMTALAEMARKYDLPIQTHLSENLDEIATVKGMNPTCRSYTEIYERAGLLTNKTLLAHGIHLDDEELDVIRKHGASIIHCPSSNCFLQSGVCDTMRLLDKNSVRPRFVSPSTDCQISVCLGTDMGAGYSPSILEVMRRSVDVSSVLTNCRRDFGLSKNSSGPYSNHSSSQHSNHSSGLSNHSSGPHSKGPLPNSTLDSASKSAKPLNFERAFYLATMGGAKALNLDGHIGNFACGKRFDALVINMDVPDSPLDFYQELTLQEKFLKFFFTGDDRNIQRV